jgi:RHS repeat-associated protein
VSYELDAKGNVTKVTETEVVPGSQSTETYVTNLVYHALCFVRKSLDPKGNEVTATRDRFGRTVQTSQDMGGGAAVITKWQYDVHDNVTVLEDDNGSQTLYEYDLLNRLKRKTYEDATTVEFLYDAKGNVTRRDDQNGTELYWTYDDLDRMVAWEAVPGTGVVGDTDASFAYDALDRLTQAQDDDSTVVFTYDSLSRVLSETQGANPVGTTGKTVTCSHDPEANLTQVDYPSGFEAHRSYDALNRLASVVDHNTASVASFALHGAGGRRQSVGFGNGTATEYGYDGFRRPSSIEHATSTPTVFAGFAYGWDKNDNPLYEARSHQGGRGWVYSYDRANRLVTALDECDDPAAEVATPSSEAYVQSLAYNMDDVFNLTSYVVTPYGGSASTTNFTVNAMNEYTAVGGVTHLYHDNGSLNDDGTYTYKYDSRDHLVEVRLKSNGSLVAEYFYDAVGLGRRTKKVVGQDTTRFVYHGLHSVEEYDGSGDLLRLFAFGDDIDQVVMMEAPDVADVDDDQDTSEVLRFHYHTQLAGSVTHVTGPAQSVVESYEYDPYGATTIKDQGGATVSASPIGNPFMYTGRRLDEETGLYYYRSRHYSPELKRFVQRDPLEYVDGPNALAYVRAAPTRYLDPSGLTPNWSPSGTVTTAAIDQEVTSTDPHDHDAKIEAIGSYGRTSTSTFQQMLDSIRTRVVMRASRAIYRYFEGSIPSGTTTDAPTGWKVWCGQTQYQAMAEATVVVPSKISVKIGLNALSAEEAANWKNHPQFGGDNFDATMATYALAAQTTIAHEWQHATDFGAAWLWARGIAPPGSAATLERFVESSAWHWSQYAADREALQLAREAAVRYVSKMFEEFSRVRLQMQRAQRWPYTLGVPGVNAVRVSLYHTGD